MSVSVCVCVCVCVCPRSYLQKYTSHLHQSFVHVAYSSGSVSSGGVMIRYAFPVLWMTSFAHKPRLLDVAA